MEELLGLLDPILGPLLETLLAVVGESFADSFPALSEVCSLPAIAGAGYLVAGGAIGFAASVDFPARFTHLVPVFPGVSIILAPLAVGTAMHLYGNWRRSRGANPTWLATFWGGALFGFGAALTRFVMVGR